MRIEKKDALLVIIYTICILVITILSREANLIHKVELIPFWSVKEWTAGNNPIGVSFLMNILLFIPMGYLLENALIKRIGNEKKAVLIAVAMCGALSLGIELIQYITYHGFCDVDDLISNLIGGMLGAAGCLVAERFSSKLRQIISLALVFVGIVCCFVVGFQDHNSEPNYYMQEFAFDITGVKQNKDGIRFDGFCYVYDHKTPGYQIVLNDKQTGEKITTDLSVNRNDFRARADIDSSREYEVEVLFKHHQNISAKVFIADGRVQYVSEATPALSVPEMDDVINNGVLKVYNNDHDAYVYQYGDKIHWLIGKEIPSDTEVIYHIYTNEPEKLPEERQQYGFDNRGFSADVVEGRQCGDYRIFEADIPTGYNITEIDVGFNTAGTITWRDCFRPIVLGRI